MQGVFQLQICGRETEVTAALVAMRNVALDTPPVPQKARRLIGTARFQGGTDFG